MIHDHLVSRPVFIHVYACISWYYTCIYLYKCCVTNVCVHALLCENVHERFFYHKYSPSPFHHCVDIVFHYDIVYNYVCTYTVTCEMCCIHEYIYTCTCTCTCSLTCCMYMYSDMKILYFAQYSNTVCVGIAMVMMYMYTCSSTSCVYKLFFH